jgi:hypothetical protein
VTSRADRLLEGFKLGSLGVSRKPHVAPEPEEPLTFVKIVKEGVNKYSGFSLGKEVTADEPYLCWKDPDGMSYFLELVVDKDKGPEYATLNLYGGENLTTEEHFGQVAATRFQWKATNKSWFYKNIETSYKKCVGVIKRSGMNYFANSVTVETLKPDGVFGHGFEEWRQEKIG